MGGMQPAANPAPPPAPIPAQYGDVAGRGVKGMVLESFGVGNMPDRADSGWLPWLREQRRRGVLVYLSSQVGGVWGGGRARRGGGARQAMPHAATSCARLRCRRVAWAPCTPASGSAPQVWHAWQRRWLDGLRRSRLLPPAAACAQTRAWAPTLCACSAQWGPCTQSCTKAAAWR